MRTFIFCAAIGFENANNGNARLMKALWYFSMSVLPSMSYSDMEETSVTGRSARRAQPSTEFHLVELNVDESSNACRGSGESGDDLASNTLRGVAVGRLDAVVERAAVGCQKSSTSVPAPRL